MDIYEITGYQTGISRAGVNFLQPADSFQNIYNGYIYRQVLQSRQGFKKFSTGYLAAGHLPTRVMGIFQNILTASNETETLAIDKNFLYVYNEGTNAFDRIPFGGSLAAFAGFAIAENDEYVSGTTYPNADGSQRFVFTGKGMSGVYFYNGTDVRNFTSVADNPNYQAFASGTINKAFHVFWFGERLNFIAPTIGGTFFPVGMLYSGIRTTSGNGDKFNVSGSGLLQLDTYQYITGASILGNQIILNANRSNWVIEKTRDVFNPYFSRKVPSVLGTDASFSMISWSDEVKSIGKTGIISTDGRQSLRIDSKIPYFTADEINQVDFDLTYGGFDRINSQFMWAYREDESALVKTQDKVLINNYEEGTWSINDQRFSCFGESINGQNLVWNDIFEDNDESWISWDTTEQIWSKIGLGKETQKTLAGDDLGFIYELNQDFDDYFVTISGITKASSAVVSTQDQDFQIGDRVVFSSVVGMSEINGRTATVTSRTLSTITVNIDSTNFTAYSSAGFVSKLIGFYAETIPFNPYREVGKMCWISHVEFLIDTNGGNLYVDVYQDEEESPFKYDVLLQPSSTTTKAREWIAMEVNNSADFMTFVLRQESASVQLKLTSMRIHCKMADYTTD